jgi:hypothetical protein
LAFRTFWSDGALVCLVCQGADTELDIDGRRLRVSSAHLQPHILLSELVVYDGTRHLPRCAPFDQPERGVIGKEHGHAHGGRIGWFKIVVRVLVSASPLDPTYHSTLHPLGMEYGSEEGERDASRRSVAFDENILDKALVMRSVC